MSLSFAGIVINRDFIDRSSSGAPRGKKALAIRADTCARAPTDLHEAGHPAHLRMPRRPRDLRDLFHGDGCQARSARLARHAADPDLVRPAPDLKYPLMLCSPKSRRARIRSTTNRWPLRSPARQARPYARQPCSAQARAAVRGRCAWQWRCKSKVGRDEAPDRMHGGWVVGNDGRAAPALS